MNVTRSELGVLEGEKYCQRLESWRVHRTTVLAEKADAAARCARFAAARDRETS